MKDQASLLVRLIAALALVGFVALWAAPAEPGPEKGVPVAGWTVCDLKVGDDPVQRTFTLEHAFSRISLSYDIEEARHVRTSFRAPDGTLTEAVPRSGPGGTDILDLEVREPALGTWQWSLGTYEGPQGDGYLTQGDFVVLGFGLEGDVRRTDATGGTQPTGTCS